MKFAIFAIGAAIAAATPATAVQIFSIGYDTPNGNGNASTGSAFNYWDLNYSGVGSTTTDGAPLSGGSGDLTDGVAASDFWYNVENFAGTGPYVGWVNRPGGVSNPLLTFYFSGGPTITSLSAHIDNSFFGSVGAPASVLVNGVDYGFTGPAPGTIGWLTVSGLNLTGNTLTVQFNQRTDFAWVFVSEVTFDGSASVVPGVPGIPEPATWAMMIAGFGFVGAAARRRRAVYASA